METNNFFTKAYVQTLLTLILVGVLTALAAYTYYTLKQAQGVYSGETTISVTGEGEVLAVPDIGSFTFGVRGEGQDAATAQADSTSNIGAIVDYLAEAGVEETDIKTENYNLNPRYRYEERVCSGNSYCPPGEQIIDGYEVYQNITVKVRDLDTAGDLITGVGERGATNISSLQFTIDDESELETQVRKAAIADAQTKAKDLANDLDKRLGKMVGFYEEDSRMPMYYGGDTMNRSFAMDEMAVESAVLPTGENEVKSVVTITYELE